MNTIQIRLYDLVRKEFNLSDDKAASFVSAMEEVVAQEIEASRNVQATKEDIHRLELRIESSKTDINKAIFGTSLVQLLGILGGVLALIKFVK